MELRREVAVATSTPTPQSRRQTRSAGALSNKFKSVTVKMLSMAKLCSELLHLGICAKAVEEVKMGELENCMVEPRKIQNLINDDMIYEIQLWLPVISLLRFKCVSQSWRALIESSYFIKQHLHRHHYDPSLKDKNHNLVYLLPWKNSPITFPFTSIEGFEEPSICLQLNSPDLQGYIPFQLSEMASYDGIICLSFLTCKGKQDVCLWNPTTKQSRVLPQSPFVGNITLSIGFGFDIKSNDYKVVKLIRGSSISTKVGFEVYSLNTGSWKSITTVFPYCDVYDNPRMPFNKGTCFFWRGYSSTAKKGIFCFDFSSEMFRFISLPRADFAPMRHRTAVVHNKITCFLRTNEGLIELWMFNEYGTINESWNKLFTIDTYFSYLERSIEGVSMSGNHVFFVRKSQMCRFNVVTKEINCFALNDGGLYFGKFLVGFKESLVSIKEGDRLFAEDSRKKK